MRNRILSTTEYEDLCVIVSRKKWESFQYYEQYLHMCRNLLDRPLAEHGVISVYRIDLTFPESSVYPDPKLYYAAFIALYRKELRRMNLDPQYLIRMEQKDSLNPHFHLAVAVKGAVSATNLKEMANALWMTVLQTTKSGLVDYCRYNRKTGETYPEEYVIACPYYCLNNTALLPQEYHEAFRMISYLAKYQEDDIVPSNERKIFSSLGCRESE